MRSDLLSSVLHELQNDSQFLFDNPAAKTRVVVAMSGGVDSSVAAALMKHMGFEVIGITLQLYDHGQALQKKGACCAGQDIHDARKVADQLGIPHHVLDYESKFQETVVENFVNSYLQGETPIPCVQCNQSVKFKDLFDVAQNLGADALVTGHYVRWTKENYPKLKCAQDLTKDQSYFLFATTFEQLKFLRFPLGGFQKSTTRKLAEGFGLLVQDKPDSQDICFVPGGDYSKVIQMHRPDALKVGEVVDTKGNVLGYHPGIIHFTIGQRKGIGISHPEPLYVIKLVPSSNQVVVGPKESLLCNTVYIRDINWIDPFWKKAKKHQKIQVKLRSTHRPCPAQFFDVESQQFHENALCLGKVVLDQPEHGISPGQACVLYDQDQILGGGWISHASREQG